MAITSIKTGSSFTNLVKHENFLAGNAAFIPNSYESISTVTVGSGGSASISFTSIPATYTHLQVRGIVQSDRSGYVVDEMAYTFNSDTGSNYGYHILRGGYGTSPAADADNVSSSANARVININSGVAANVFSVFTMDILDYANTNKYKTTRTLVGFDVNGTVGTGSYGGTIALNSGLWRSSSAITSITFSVSPQSTLFNQYSQFALYGIKGA